MSSSKGCERGVRRWVVEGCGRLDSPTSIEGDLNCRNQVGISRDEHGDVVAVVSGAQSKVEGDEYIDALLLASKTISPAFPAGREGGEECQDLVDSMRSREQPLLRSLLSALRP